MWTKPRWHVFFAHPASLLPGTYMISADLQVGVRRWDRPILECAITKFLMDPYGINTFGTIQYLSIFDWKPSHFLQWYSINQKLHFHIFIAFLPLNKFIHDFPTWTMTNWWFVPGPFSHISRQLWDLRGGIRTHGRRTLARLRVRESVLKNA